MSRNTEYQFVPTDPDEVVAELIAKYEEITGGTVHPASPERLFIQYVAAIIIQERVQNNFTGNQNIPSRAEHENLDALAELFYEQKRPGARAASCTMRFTISEAQKSAVLVPAGTRITDANKTLVWVTPEDVYIPIGETHVDVQNVTCQSAGAIGNDYTPGQINKLIDVYDYYKTCQNITASAGGADAPDDDTFYETLRSSMDGYSCAGSLGGYAYFAKRVSGKIIDVCPNSPSPGMVFLYVLMEGGQIAGEEMKSQVLAACNAERVRAFTDYVQMGDPEIVPYNIDLTYYIPEDSRVSAAEVEKAVTAAVEKYIAWQSAKLGRDINPSRLYQLLMSAGIKRVELRSPAFKPLRDGKLVLPAHYDDYESTVPQVANLEGTPIILNGGYEDE